MMGAAVHGDHAAHRLTRQRRLEPGGPRVGQRKRRKGVTAGHDRALRVEHEQQFVAGVALAVVGQEVADGGAVGAHERQQIRERG